MKSKLSLLALLMPLTFFNNCSDVSFKDSASNGSDDGSFSTELNQPGSNPTTSTPSTPTTPTTPPTPTAPQIVPKVTFIGPPCQRLTLCQAEFRLDKAYSLRTEFDWRTNDTLYMTPHSPVYAQPGVHYNSTNGHIIFEPGETSKKIYIQNINGSTAEVIIGVIMSVCKYGTYNGTCASFFQ
jgi:hypothetical protein